MELIDQSSELWGECPSDPNEAVLWIERAGRVCYRSEDKIIDGSGIKFVNNIVKRKHYSVIEHSNLVLRSKDKSKHPRYQMEVERSVFDSNFFNFCIDKDRTHISGNWRAWIEWLNRVNPDERIETIEDFITSFQYAENDEYEMVTGDDIPLEAKMITAEFVTDRAVTHELVRHRPASYSQESQRYVRYDGGMLFVKPAWYDYAKPDAVTAWTQSVGYAEKMYIRLREAGMKAEDARTILPNSTATKIVMTAPLNEWKHVFKLRLSPAAYPQIRNMLTPIRDGFEENGWL